MGQLVSEIILNLGGNLAAKARTYGNSMSEFARKNQTAMGITSRSIQTMSRGLDSISNRYTALAAGVVTSTVLNSYKDLDRRISRFAVAADLGKDKARDLYKQVEDIANLPEIKLDPSLLFSALEEIQKQSGDTKYALDNLFNMGAVIQGADMDGTAVGSIFNQLKKMQINSSKAAMEAIDTLNMQGKSGAFPLSKMSADVFSAYAATGRSGTQAVREMGAALQVIMTGAATEPEAITSYRALIRDLTNPERVRILKSHKINIFDPEGLKKGKEIMRPLPTIMKELVEKSKGLSINLGELHLSDEAKNALNPVITDFNAHGNVTAFDQFMNIIGDGSTTMGDAKIVADDFQSSLQSIQNVFSKFSNDNLANPVQELADALNKVDKKTVDNWLELGKNVALVVGGVVAAKKGLDAAEWMKGKYDFIRGKKGQPGSSGPGEFGIGGATPVYVVNMPGGGVGGIPTSTTTPTGSPTSKGGKFGRIVEGASNLANKAIVVGAMYEGSDFLASHLVNDSGLRDAARKTDVGRYIDDRGIPGMTSDLWDLLKSSAAESQRFAQQQQAELYGNLNIRVSDDRVRVSQSGFNYPSLNVNVDNGRSMTGGD